MNGGEGRERAQVSGGREPGGVPMRGEGREPGGVPADGGVEPGLVMVYTGNGKGKTTAALGLAMRAVGQGLRVLMLQFIKGGWRYGELDSARLLPNFDLRPMGLGFTWDRRHAPEEHRAAIRRCWEAAKEAIRSGAYDLVILDEMNNVFNVREFPVADVLPLGEVLEVLRGKPRAVHVLITGRDAPAELVALADLVTEMRDVKHPFHEGRRAVRGIEY